MKKPLQILVLLFIVNCTLQIAKAQWTQLPNLPITGTVRDMYFANANTGWMTFNTTGTILKTTNGGQGWVQQTTPAAEVYNIQFFNDTLGLALSYLSGNMLIIKTTNGGTNWNTIYTTTNVFGDITFLNKDTAWVCGGDGNNSGMWITTDGGLSFQRQYTGIPGSFGHIFFLKQKGPSGYIGWVSEVPQVYRTSNSGVNWTLIYSGFTTFCSGTNISDMYFTDSLNGVITKQRSCFHLTSNGGYNWTTINELDAVGGKVAMGNKQTGWITFTMDSIVKTTNFFQTYGRQPIPIAVNKIFAVDTSVVYAAYDQTSIIKTTDGGGNITNVELISTEMPNKYLLYQNYPNPFNPETKIEFSLPKSSHVKLVVYDLLGNEIEALVDESLKAGNYSVNWVPKNISSGLYFYYLETENFRDTKKMILIK